MVSFTTQSSNQNAIANWINWLVCREQLLSLALYPGSRGEGKGEPGINCVCMRFISPDSGENRIFSVYYPVYLTFNPGKRSAELREGPNNEGFQATSGLYLCYNGLLSVLGLIRCFSPLEGVGGKH